MLIRWHSNPDGCSAGISASARTRSKIGGIALRIAFGGVAALAGILLAAGCGDTADEHATQTRSEISPWEIRLRKISALRGGFTGELSDHDSFGSAVATIGDVDGDGVTDLAVGAPWDENEELVAHGAVWVLFLKPDGTVRSHAKIAPGSGVLPDAITFGAAIAAIGDVDGDGVPDLAVATGEDDPNEPIWIVMLTRNGQVKAAHPILPADVGAMSRAPSPWGLALSGVGDLDGDGRSELATVAFIDRLCLLSLSSLGAVRNYRCAGLEEQMPIYASALAAPGDVNRDGTADLAAGGLFIPLTPDLQMHTPVQWWDFWNDPSGARYLPFDALAAIGDFDGDGISELATFAEQVVGPKAGLAMIYLSPEGRFRSVRFFDHLSERTGIVTGMNPRGSVAALGDLDGDGLNEIAIGSPQDDDAGPGRGAVWIASVSNRPRATTTTSSTTTTFVTTTTVVTCDPQVCEEGNPTADYHLEIYLLTTRAVGALQFEIGYDPSSVDFVGSSDAVQCRPEQGVNALMLFNDCDGESAYCRNEALLIGMVSLQGVTGPTRLATCALRSIGSAPSAKNFGVTILDAAAPNFRPIEAAVELRIVGDVEGEAFSPQ